MKTLAPQDIPSLDRIRNRLIKHRTAIITQLRGLLSEYSILSKVGAKNLLQEIPFILEDAANSLTVAVREFIQALYLEATKLEKKIAENERNSESFAVKAYKDKKI